MTTVGTNPFIKKGEFYFAGNYLFNMWTPAYPGAVGCVEQWCLNGGKQELFHCFLHCARSPHKHWPNYLGPDAEGKRLYLGRYQEVPFDKNSEEPNVVGHRFPFKNLSWASQIHIAKKFHEYSEQGNYSRSFVIDGEERIISKDQLEPKHVESAKAEAESDKEGSWDKMRDLEKHGRTWVEMMLEKQFYMDIVPIEFVDYDEELYNKLVETSADNGEVSLDESKLGPL